MAVFGADRCGAAAVEFALVSVVFILTLTFTLGVALVIFLQQQLDHATDMAARQVMNGTVQKGAYSAAVFRQQVVCVNLPTIFSCGDTIVNLWTATEATSPGGYYSFVKSGAAGLVIPQLSNSVAQYSVGVQGSYEYLQVIYPITFLPSFVTSLFSSQTYNGVAAYMAVSTAAFRNEQY
ncbi:pilus assembly protein [Lichenihabitans sp. Uapishka_5]|uniref:TadE/TadG family type IV pilus assembly protein n=1 Tax=Lichenihabitans sp. Uapishka_5 TaxID=3037302 RepID=UPI0029E82989|nr:TadE family protein [Lichenihabitans sp. Uapishka_5]MDX7953809.1 pilus assembly protein [Lichenihabitans sp. Uapishka_5]